MSLNYHELTMHEPRDSPERRKQFLVICSVMASVFVYSAMTSGLFQPVKPAVTQGVFPGGNFCYKYASRDYAASMGLGRSMTEDFVEETKKRIKKEVVVVEDDDSSEECDNNSTTTTTAAKKKATLPGDDVKRYSEDKMLTSKMEDHLYHLYLDDPYEVTGMHQRWMTGVLVPDSDKAEFCDPLLAKNPTIERVAQKNQHVPFEEKKAKEVFESTTYEIFDLPSVDSLVLQFPFTDGFVSALVFSYKVLPVLRKLGAEQGEEGSVPVVISHCSKEQQMCTHYVPLVQGKAFLIGRPTSEEHIEAIGQQPFFISYTQMKAGARKIAPFLKDYIDMLP